jgi:hypothetical protein
MIYFEAIYVLTKIYLNWSESPIDYLPKANNLKLINK